MSESKALSTVDERSVRVIENKERLVIRRMRRVVEQGALDATRIDDEGPPPEPKEGEKAWTRDRLRVAQDMRKSKRNAPVYLEHMQRSVEKHDDRQAAHQQTPTQLNIGTINVVQAAVYPAIELETKE